MSKFIGFVYGVAAYCFFLAAFLYAVGFVADWLVPKSIDSGAGGDLPASLLINTVLLGIFAVQHSVMARPGFKKWWTQIVPHSIERSTYVLLSSLALLLLYWQWQPLPDVVWEANDPAAVTALWILHALGWLTALASTFAISHVDLFGLRQVYLNVRGKNYSPVDFRIVGLYKLVRHPLMLGFIVAFWATPRMTVGHLFFAAATTLYIFIALQFEERDLLANYGDKYREYKNRVPMVLPFAGKQPAQPPGRQDARQTT